jgi:transposase
MNQLKMDIQLAINTLSRNGWSQRRIARELGVDRETVARYRKLARQAQEPKPAIVPAGSKSGRLSHCQPFKTIIQAGLERGLSAQRIYQDLVTEQKFEGGYDSVKKNSREYRSPFGSHGTGPSFAHSNI